MLHIFGLPAVCRSANGGRGASWACYFYPRSSPWQSCVQPESCSSWWPCNKLAGSYQSYMTFHVNSFTTTVGGSNSEHLISELIWNWRFLMISIGMVRFWNGQNCNYNCQQVRTIQNRNRHIRIQDGIQKSPNHSQTKLFTNQTVLDHSKNMFSIPAPTLFGTAHQLTLSTMRTWIKNGS